MGFYVTLTYLAILILTPGGLIPELAPYRVQWWFGGLAALLSAAMVPLYGYPVRNPQTILTVALLGQVMASRLALGWVGGAVFALVEFGSVLVVYFLLVAGRPSLGRLRGIALVLVIPALYVVTRGIAAVYLGSQPEIYVMAQTLWDGNAVALGVVERIKYLGFFSDPNDLAQYFLICVPMVALLWKRGRFLMNFGVVLPAIAYLLFGMYLTHSRGVLVGLVVVVMTFLYDRFNKVVMTFGTAGVVVAGLAANFSGGRTISFSSGSDRIEAWGAGFAMLRERPLFGVGYNMFLDHHELTAHNSFVLCFAELGMIGFFIWLGLLVSTILGLNRFIRRFRHDPAAHDLVRWALAVRMALLSFIATGWFLSRTYSVLLYVLIAMWVIIDQLAAPLQASALAEPAPSAPAAAWRRPRLERYWHWAPATATVQVFCLVLLYVMVRARWAQ